MRRNSLEAQSWFPVVAWVLVICFAAFTGSLALAMQRELSEIGERTSRIEQSIVDLNTLDELIDRGTE